MTTTSHEIFTASGSDIPLKDRDAVAREAVREFRKLQNTLTAYARMLTGNKKLRVEVSSTSNGSSDGERIYYRPPLELGLKPRHDRGLCDKRDKNLELRCQACHAREAVLGVIYHEIAHTAYGSFDTVTDTDLADFTVDAVKSTEGYYADQILKRINAAPYSVKCKFMPLAHLISQWLPILLNAIEDARVNRMMFNSRPGTKVMFDAAVQRVMRQGVLQIDKTYMKWIDQPPNIQILIGAFCIASRYDISGWFSPKVLEDLKDPELVELLKKVDKLRSVAGSYHLTFPVLARLRELGYCLLPEDPEEPEDAESEPGEEGSDGAEEGSPGEGEGTSESSSGEDSGDEKEASSGGSGGGSSSDGDSSGGDSEPGEPEQDQPSDSEAGTDSEGDGGTAGEDGNAGTSTSGDPAAGTLDPGTGESSEGGSRSSVGDRDSDDDGQSGSQDRSTGGDSGSEDDPDASDGGSSGDGSGDELDNSSTTDSPETGEDAGQDNLEETADEVDSNSSDSPDGDEDAERSGEQDAAVDDSDSSAAGDGAGSSTDDDGAGREGDGTSPGADGNDESADSSDDNREADSSSSSNNETPVQEDQEDEEAIPLDTGADLGKGGITVVGEEDVNVEMGTPEQGKIALLKLGDHEHDALPTSIEAKRDAKKLEADLEKIFGRAIIQSLYFETGSKRVWGVREHYYDKHFILKSGSDASTGWNRDEYSKYGHGELISAGIEGDFDPEESILSPALQRLRKAFSDNAMGGKLRHRKSGRVDRASLGKRAPIDDPRVFHKRLEVVKTDDFVEICIDISGSTYGENLVLAKKAALAQCILMHRLGIPFVAYAHSAFHDWHETPEGTNLDIYHIKDEHEPWTEKIAKRLKDLCPAENNLDGHTLEYYRRRAEESHAVRRTIMYYTDGKMPAENYDEELAILQREIKKCKQLGIYLMGVGIRTDSPIKHGLDTVQIDSTRDIIKVVAHLEKRLAGR